MISTYGEKHYKSAHGRLLEKQLSDFFKKHLPQIGGPDLREFISIKLLDFLDQYMPRKDRVQPGQMLWTAVSKYTRADSSKAEYKPVVLTLITKEEIDILINEKATPTQLTEKVVARIIEEAYEQEALLSMRDIALILKRCPSHVSEIRARYEKKKNVVLPTPAVLHDMGSGITHKVVILKKLLLEKKDMAQIRNETGHTQGAIDRYLKDYRRVEMLLDDNKNVDYISRVTRLRKHLVKQYEDIYCEIKYTKISS